MLDCPVGTVKTHILRAKQKLKSQLAAWAPRVRRGAMSERRSLPRSDPATTGSTRALRADGREHRADYLADDGFTARVMAKLPVPRDAARVAQAGGRRAVGRRERGHRRVACPAPTTDVAREFFRVVAGHPVSLAQIASGVSRSARRELDRSRLGAAPRLTIPHAAKRNGRPRRPCIFRLPARLLGELEIDFDSRRRTSRPRPEFPRLQRVDHRAVEVPRRVGDDDDHDVGHVALLVDRQPRDDVAFLRRRRVIAACGNSGSSPPIRWMPRRIAGFGGAGGGGGSAAGDRRAARSAGAGVTAVMASADSAVVAPGRPAAGRRSRRRRHLRRLDDLLRRRRRRRRRLRSPR